MKFLKNNLGVFIVAALAIVPVLMWVFMKPLAGRFAPPASLFRSLGQVAGLLGMSLLSINFMLSTRFRFLDDMFRGLNKVYDKHHLIGALSFCLLLFHPVFLIIQYLNLSLESAFVFIFSIGDLATDLGKLALASLMLLLVITFYSNFKYENWKKTHKYLGIVLLLASVHMLLVPSDISSNAALKYYMLTLAFFGGFSYLYRTIFRAYREREYKYQVEEVNKITESVAELKLKPVSGKMDFLPGQFVFVRFETEGILSESHPFSISSSSLEDGRLSLGIKALGDYTSMAHLIKPGLICRIEGPFGAFSFSRAGSKRQIWVAGGIGITPFLGMAREIDKNPEYKRDYMIDLYYSIKNQAEAAFAEELEEMARLNRNFRFHRHFSEKDGYISAKDIVKADEASGSDVFLCGPLPFMRGLRAQFIALGFDNERIHSEEFNLSI